MTLYLTLGGLPAMTRATHRLTRRLRIDGGFLEASQIMTAQRQEDLLDFLIFLSGGAPSYEGMPVSQLLSPLCPTNESFDLFVDHLATCLIGQQRSVPAEADLRLMMEHIRPHVVPPFPMPDARGADRGSAVA